MLSQDASVSASPGWETTDVVAQLSCLLNLGSMDDTRWRVRHGEAGKRPGRGTMSFNRHVVIRCKRVRQNLAWAGYDGLQTTYCHTMHACPSTRAGRQLCRTSVVSTLLNLGSMDATRWRARRGEVGKRPVRGVPGGAGGVGGGVGIVPKRSAA